MHPEDQPLPMDGTAPITGLVVCLASIAGAAFLIGLAVESIRLLMMGG